MTEICQGKHIKMCLAEAIYGDKPNAGERDGMLMEAWLYDDKTPLSGAVGCRSQ